MLASTPRATANIGCRKFHRSGSQAGLLPTTHVHRRRLRQRQDQNQQHQQYKPCTQHPTGNGPCRRYNDERRSVYEAHPPKHNVHDVNALLHKIQADVACLSEALHQFDDAHDPSRPPHEVLEAETQTRVTRKVSAARSRPRPARPVPALVPSALASASTSASTSAAPPAVTALVRRPPSVRVPSSSDMSGESSGYTVDWDRLSGRFERSMGLSWSPGSCRRESFRTEWGECSATTTEADSVGHSRGDESGQSEGEGESENESESENEPESGSESESEKDSRTPLPATAYVDDGNYHPFPLALAILCN
ncbi:hypothetical protein E4U55_006965 [Claviceps digitariae]|nr:hypothetical protein E4U55_006965 [Claviceps digitariae]